MRQSKPYWLQRWQDSFAWGMVAQIDLLYCLSEIVSERDSFVKFVPQLCNIIDMRSYGDMMLMRFGDTPALDGWSFCQMIETSSITGHFPIERRSGYLDIFSCKFFDPDEATEFARSVFKPEACRLEVQFRR